MPEAYRISGPLEGLNGTIVLEPSKSISNRALIIQSLCKDPFQIDRLSKSDDTIVLQKMLSSDSDVIYGAHAGTSYRFMIARACLGTKDVTLTASEQLMRRPVGPLVKALQTLGANITYLKKEGFPPVRVSPSPDLGQNVKEIRLQSGISSQYISALLLVAPYLPQGLKIELTEKPVSFSYVRMTLDMMNWFGINAAINDNVITVAPGEYAARDYTVEGDWSAASYYYSIMALSKKGRIQINGLQEASIQGDAVMRDMGVQFGVDTAYNETGIELSKNGAYSRPGEFHYDFSNSPDLAQTVMVMLAGSGIPGRLSGLKTLRIKETDRISAMKSELSGIHVHLDVSDAHDDISCTLTGRAQWKKKTKINTHGDHRMAMAFAPLACLHPVIIRDPHVVSKSYPGFWHDLTRLGFTTEKWK